MNVETVRRKSGLMRALATPAAVLLLGGVTTDAVRVTHDVNFDASLFRSTVVARPRIDLYAEHRKFGYHLRGGDSEVIGGEREVPLVPENVPLAWKMIGWILGGA